MTEKARTSLFATTMFLVFGLKILDFDQPNFSHNLWAYFFFISAIISLSLFIYFKINR